MQSNPKLKEGYSNFIQEFVDLEHLEKVPPDEIEKPNDQLNFLSHHCVEKIDSTTTKLRFVFDGSAKSDNGTSLNSSLMVGPTIQQDLFSLLIRFRLHRVALTADIAKMYRQLVLDTPARDFHRFLWREDPNHQITQFGLKSDLWNHISCLSFSQSIGRSCEQMSECRNC